MVRKSALLLSVVLMACRNQDEAGADALWEEVQEADYTMWDRAPGYEMRRESGAPHGNMVDIYVNDVIAEALTSGEKLTAWPEGSLIVKDGFEDDSPHLVAIMEMRAEGWFFAEYEPDGKVLFSGSPRTCTKCHGGAGILAFPLP
jgi:hypothetical protein